MPATLVCAARLLIAVALATVWGAVSDERGDPTAWPTLRMSAAVAQESAAKGVFHGVGVVTAVDNAKGWLTLDHKAIAGFMGAMEMMYRVEPLSLPPA